MFSAQPNSRKRTLFTSSLNTPGMPRFYCKPISESARNRCVSSCGPLPGWPGGAAPGQQPEQWHGSLHRQPAYRGRACFRVCCRRL